MYEHIGIYKYMYVASQSFFFFFTKESWLLVQWHFFQDYDLPFSKKAYEVYFECLSQDLQMLLTCQIKPRKSQPFKRLVPKEISGRRVKKKK
jgi:hypothetical protein